MHSVRARVGHVLWCVPRRAIALGHSPRPCAGSRTHRRPHLSMVENRSRRAPTPICVQRPRGPESQGPVTACAVAPSLSATPADRAPARASTADPVYRWSKIGRVARPRQHACNDRGGRNPEVRYQPAPSRHRSRLLSQTVRRLAQAPPTPFRDGRKSVASRARANMHATTEGAEFLRSAKLSATPPYRSRHPVHSRRRFSMLENLFLRPPAPICVQASV